MLLPFATDCGRCGEKYLIYLDPARQEERLQSLAEAGIDVHESSENGLLELRTWDEAYLRGSGFDPDEMLASTWETGSTRKQVEA